MIDWQAIDTVLLDMDGTLLDLYFDNHFWLQHLPSAYAQARSMTVEAAKAQLVARFAQEQGQLNWYCIDFWEQELGLNIVALKQETAHLIQPRAGALSFLHAIRESGRHAWLVTNAHHKSLAIKLARTPLSELCDQIICSHDFKAPKEADTFWPALQAHAYFDPARSLFIDDSESVLLSAQRFGIQHLLTIAQPDSQLPARHQLRFSALHHFDDLLPISPRC